MSHSKALNGEDFQRHLEDFYRKRLNRPLAAPCVNGKELQLWQLYQKVTSLGGWQKVSANNRWRDVAGGISCFRGTIGGDHAVKLVYMRYLAKFEQFVAGVEPDEDEPTSSHRSSKPYLAALTSSHSSRSSCKVPDTLRTSFGLPPKQKHRSSYFRLLRSLESGLPNEVDFAINVAILLSNPGQSCLRLYECPAVIELLLAHVGIFEQQPSSFRCLYDSSWKHHKSRKFVKFWFDFVDDPDLKEFLGAPELNSATDWHANDELFLLSQDAEFGGVVCQRISQVASIFRNLSFEPANRSIMGQSSLLLVFLLECIACSKWSFVQSLALDTLSNTATDVGLLPVDHMLTQLLFRTLTRCLHSDDKFHVIRALETIGNLCACEENETVLMEYLDVDTISRIIALISVKDIMLCVYLVECLYQVSETGESLCTRIAVTPRAVDTLVDLVTIEAGSLGAAGLSGMKVVQYGPQQPQQETPGTSNAVGNANVRFAVPNQVQPTVAQQQRSNIPASSVPLALAVPPMRPNSSSAARNAASALIASQRLAAVAQPSTVGTPTNVLKHEVSIVAPPQSFSFTGGTNIRLLAQGNPRQNFEVAFIKPYKSVGNLTAIDSSRLPQPMISASLNAPRIPSVTVQPDQMLEQVALSWLRQNCQLNSSFSVSRSEIYTQYVQWQSSQPSGLNVVSISMFANLVKQAFPSCVFHQADEMIPNKAPSVQIIGIRVAPSGAASESSLPQTAVAGPSHPAIQRILNAQVPSAAAASPTVGFKPPQSVQPLPPSVNNNSCPLISPPITVCNNSNNAKTSHSQSILAARLLGGSAKSECSSANVSLSGTASEASCSGTSTPDSLTSGSTNFDGSNQGAFSLNNSYSPSQSPNASPSSNAALPTNFAGLWASSGVSGEKKPNVAMKTKKAKPAINEDSQQRAFAHGHSEAKSVIRTDATNGSSTDAIIEAVLMATSLGDDETSSKAFCNGDASLDSIPEAQSATAVHSNHHSAVTINENGETSKDSSDVLNTHTEEQSADERRHELLKQILSSDSLIDKFRKPVNGTVNSFAVAPCSMETDPVKPQNHEVSTTSTAATATSETIVPNHNSISVDITDDIIQKVANSVASPVVAMDKRCSVSPGPDLDAFKQNVDNCQMDIQKLLHVAAVTTSACGDAPASSSVDVANTSDHVSAAVDSVLLSSIGECVEPCSSSATETPSASLVASCSSAPSQSTVVASDSIIDSVVASAQAAVSALRSTKRQQRLASKGGLTSTPRRPQKRSLTLDNRDFGGLASPVRKKRTSVSSNCSSAFASETGNSNGPTTSCGIASPHALPFATPPSALPSTSQSGAAANGAAVVIHKLVPPRPDQLKLMCEWNGCGRLFPNPRMLFFHITKLHIVKQPAMCMWPHCDKTVRLPWALATHLHDIHCNETTLKIAALRRYELSQCGATRYAEPRSPPPHPGYANDAAASAIRRHAANFVQKEIADENEGPVTKSLRLTTALILRNLARFSSEGRRSLRKWESSLSLIAFSNLESSSALSQCLAELTPPAKSP